MATREGLSPEALIREWGPEAAKCSRCGFCQPTCPIYRETGREAHVARGKSFLLRKMAEDQIELEPGLREAFDNCLLCRACTANCFPAVRTDEMVMAFREAYAGRWGRPLVQRLLFRHVLPRPAAMSRLFGLAFSSRLPAVGRRAQQRGLLTLLNPKMDMAMRLAPRAPQPFLRDRLARMDLGGAHRPLRVGYWISCGYNYMLPEVGVSTVRVLRALGAQVVPLENACCGLPVQSYGDGESARALARENLRRVERAGTLDFIVSECGSCSSHLKEYGRLLADDERWAASASAFAAHVRSFSEVFAELGAALPLASLPRHGHLPRPVPHDGALPGRGAAAPRTDLPDRRRPSGRDGRGGLLLRGGGLLQRPALRRVVEDPAAQDAQHRRDRRLVPWSASAPRASCSSPSACATSTCRCACSQRPSWSTRRSPPQAGERGGRSAEPAGHRLPAHLSPWIACCQ